MKKNPEWAFLYNNIPDVLEKEDKDSEGMYQSYMFFWGPALVIFSENDDVSFDFLQHQLRKHLKNCMVYGNIIY